MLDFLKLPLLSDSLSVGPLFLPLVLLPIVIIIASAYIAGTIPLRGDRENRRIFTNLLFTPVLPFLIGWKLSLIITDTHDVLINPLLLLYGSGGIINILIGSLISGIWLVNRWRKLKTSITVNKAMLRALGTALILTLFLVGGTSSMERNPSEREKLPVVELFNGHGESWDISMASGSPVVLNFWASWCLPCRVEMPMLARLQADPRFSEVIFYAVNAVRSEKHPDDALDWLVSNGIDLPLIFDTSGEAMSLYRISGLPTTIVLDSDGRVVERKTGAVSRSWLIGVIRKAGRNGNRQVQSWRI